MKRVLFKISGELLSKSKTEGSHGPLSSEGLYHVIEALSFYQKEGFEIGVVIGGGNLFRGHHLDPTLFRRAYADRIGMMATIINGLALEEAARTLGHSLRLFSSFSCPKMAEEFSLQKMEEAFARGEILLFAGGTGNSFFSTDSAAALKASEMGADLLVKVTQVDAVYDRDPKEPGATALKELSYRHFIEKGLKVMDLAAVILCMNQSIPILVIHRDLFGMKSIQAIEEEKLGSRISK